MLCRTASDLFWMGRVVERAEAMARLLDLARRLSALPTARGAGASRVWSLPMLATGSILPGTGDSDADAGLALARCVLERENPSSVLACVQRARDVVRNQRSVVPAELLAPVQVLLQRLRTLRAVDLAGGGLGQVIGEILAFSDAFRGVSFATMLRNEAWQFLRLGTFVERADAAVRMWATQADPEFALLRDGPDSPHAAFHRVALLEAASALMPLRRLHGEPDRRGVADMLLRRHDFPRSAAYSLGEASKALTALHVNAAEPVARQFGRALAGVCFMEPDDDAASMFAFGASRQAELRAAADAVEQRFFVARMPLRRAA